MAMLASVRRPPRDGISIMRRFMNTSSAAALEVTLSHGGKLKGRVIDPKNRAPPFQAFLGVPFAKPPVGKLRFQAPQPAEGWSGARDAAKESDLCLQADYHSKQVMGSEDCLNLAVYRPPGTGPDDRKPVIVYFQYGLWSVNNATLNDLGPEFLVSKDIIVVVVNYRVLSFGFLTLDSPVAPGNNGIKDCIAGLRWVHDNIAAFGGDPEKLTLMGVCAGAQIANLCQYLECCKGLFQRSILVSGGMFTSSIGPLPADVGRSRSLTLAKLLGCESTDDEEILAHLQKVPLMDLFAATFQSVRNPPTADRANFPFGPVVDATSVADPKDAVYPEAPIALNMKQKLVHPVPTLFGISGSEGQFFRGFTKLWAGQHGSPEKAKHMTDNLERLLPWDLNIGYPVPPWKRHIIDKARRLYFKDPKEPTVFEVCEVVSDLYMNRTVVINSWLHSTSSSRPPTWLYHFDLAGEYNRTRSQFIRPTGIYNKTSTASDFLSITSHLDDMGYYFGAGDKNPGPEPVLPEDSPEEVARRRMVALFSNFVKYGNPTPDSEPEPELRGLRWPQMPTSSGVSRPYLEITNDLRIKHDLLHERMSFIEELYRTHYIDGDTKQARMHVCWEDNAT